MDMEKTQPASVVHLLSGAVKKLLLVLFQGLEHIQRRFTVSVKDLLLGETDGVFTRLATGQARD